MADFRAAREVERKLLKEANLEQVYYRSIRRRWHRAVTRKIRAADAASNPPDRALKTERESERFEVDNTPPVIGQIKYSFKTAGVIAVSFTATDAGSNIERVNQVTAEIRLPKT